jgi:tRNA threonylcarbamoyl adenosine modification protein YjeE
MTRPAEHPVLPASGASAGRLLLPDPEATDALAARLAAVVGAGDTLLLAGPIGAGKTHLARALIQVLQRAAGEPAEEVPSPSYTLVQTYRAGPLEIWHADLYRLDGPAAAAELGLEDAFGRALCIVEWPDRLGPAMPADALTVALAPDPGGPGRLATLTAGGPRAGALAQAALG